MASPSALAAASRATPSTTVTPQLLADAARRIEAETPWYEKLGLGYEQAAGAGGDVAVEAVLAFNVVSGLIDAASETMLAPVFVAMKGLLGAVQGSAAAREEIVELIQYCVGISRWLLEAAKTGDMPSSMKSTLGEFKGEVEAVGRFAQTYGTRSGGCCRRMVLNSHDRETAARHKQKLKDLMDAVLGGLAIQTNQVVNEMIRMMIAREPPRLTPLAEIPRGAPILPPTYVQRTALLERVVADLTNPRRSATATHCLVGMGGGGKTLMASSVVRDDRVRASFREGIFWVPVGRQSRNVARLLEYLAIELTPRHSCPRRFESEEEVVWHLSSVRENKGLRCLVVLDNVWSVEVVNGFARTGFHVMVTTRRKTAVSPLHSGLCTEVGDMSVEEALEVLRRASGADGPLPAQAASEVAHDCSFLPLALGMVGALAKDEPLEPSCWRAVREKLSEKGMKFGQEENGKLFSAINASLCNLPLAQRKQLKLMAVMASGVLATTEMLANLWVQDITDVPTGTRILTDRCLLQDMKGGFRLHDLVLEYLQLTIKMDGGALAEWAASRQARHLRRLAVLKEYFARGTNVSTGGVCSLIALWNSVNTLDKAVDAGACYMKSLKGVTNLRIRDDVGRLLLFLGSYSGAEAVLREALRVGYEQGSDELEAAATLNTLAFALERQGKYEEADALHLKAIGIEEKASDPDKARLVMSLGNRANVLEAQGKYEEADALHQRAIGIKEKALDPDHPGLVMSLNNRANVLLQQVIPSGFRRLHKV